MTCSDVRVVLSISLVPGGVDARSLLGVEEHVAGCDGCRAEKLELLRALVALELDRAEGPNLAPAIEARLEDETPRVLRWSRPVAAAAVLAVAAGLVWLLRAGDDGRSPSAAGPRPPTPIRRTAPREDSLLLANGHELRLDRRIAWLPGDGPSGAHEDWGDEILEDQAESLGLRTDLPTPMIVPPSRRDGEDERVFPVDIEGQR